MSRVSQFLTQRRSEILAHFDGYTEADRTRFYPSSSRRILVSLVSELSGQVNAAAERLQSRRVTLNHQAVIVEDMVVNLQRFAFIEKCVQDYKTGRFTKATRLK